MVSGLSGVVGDNVGDVRVDVSDVGYAGDGGDINDWHDDT